MLAVVQPYSASPDVAHRPRSTLASSSRPPQQNNLATNHPPSLQRHQTAPPAPNFPSRSTDTPPPKPATPTPPLPLPPVDTSFDIHAYPATNLLKLLALLLTHIATTNDHLAPSTSPTASGSHHYSNAPHPVDAPPIWHTLTSASRTAISTPAATLTFHARNIPTISLEAYLLRILKYCPTTNHVFLSLLVYFDRMSKLSEDAVGRAFVIDSYNIHRLVIAGVTVASKFFSDVFYTNSRYAKVGGLPLSELNQLELQFLLLNDFRLVISTTEMQHYAEQLILFSRSTTPPHPHLASLNGTGPSPNPTSSGSTLRHNSAPTTASSSPSSTLIPGTSRLNSQSYSNTSSSGSSPSSASSWTAPSSSARPLDALVGVPISHAGPYNNPNGQSHTHPPHPNSHANLHPHLYTPSHSHLFAHPQQQSQPRGYTSPKQGQNHPRHQPRSQMGQGLLNQEMEDPDPDTDTEDADTSTDTGTETDNGSETDEEPTIRAPGTVTGSVGGSVWGDGPDERMGSP